MTTKNNIPVYSLNSFSKENKEKLLYQVEVFDANRHFQVSYPHKHDFYEVLFLEKGSGIHIIDSNKYKIEPPCLFFLSPGQAHKLELSHDIAGYIFLFSAEFYLLNQKNKNRLLEFPFFYSIDQNNPPLFLKHTFDADFFRNLFIRSCNEIKRNDISDEYVRSLLDLILLTCDKLYPDDSRTVTKKKGHIIVKNFMMLIEENYQLNLRINDYAEMLAITPHHLTQLVKELTGKTSVEILQKKTLAEIKRMLLHTNLTVSQIAEFMHFPDQSYFSKYFKKLEGTSPLDYRKRKLQE